MTGSRPKGDAYLGYAIHGEGLESVKDGFRELGMPPNRFDVAYEIVAEVLAANDAAEFRWYKTPGTNELACYWGDHAVNVLWVTTCEVHIPSDQSLVRRPARPLTWSKQEGGYVGWQLPGADSGTGGGRREQLMATVRCPQTFISHPAGTVCPDCEVVHAPDR